MEAAKVALPPSVAEVAGPAARAVGSLALILLVVVLAGQLLLRPVVGVADNGDFERLMGPLGLFYPDGMTSTQKYFNYVNTRFAVGPANDWSGYRSSAEAVVGVGVGLTRLFLPAGEFDLRAVGLLYAALYAGAFSLVVRATGGLGALARAAVLGAVLLVFGDVGYFAYFNSFFSEPAALVGLVLALAIPLAWRSRGGLVAFVAAVILLATSKAPFAPLGLLLVPLTFALPWGSAGLWLRGLCAVLIAVPTLLYIALGTPDHIQRANLFDVVAYEILRTSPNPEADLSELGLPAELESQKGLTTYTPGAHVDPHIWDHFGYGDIACFYLRHPARFVDLAERGTTQAFSIHPEYLGYYEEASSRPPLAQPDSFAAWSTLKRRLAPAGGAALLAWLLACSAVTWARWRTLTASERPLTYLLAFAVAGALMEYGIAIFAAGELDLGKHLFVFNALFDAGLLLTIFGAARLARRPARWRVREGRGLVRPTSPFAGLWRSS